MSKNKLPSDLQPIYESINHEVNILHGKWKIYRQLYATNTQRIDLLNQSASKFFVIIRNSLIEDIFLAFSRLTDPARSAGWKNISLNQLVEHLTHHGQSDLVEQLQETNTELTRHCKPFRIWRNKRIAHADLEHELKLETNPLPGISRNDIEDALNLVRQFMNQINLFFFDASTIYEAVQITADGDALLNRLQIAAGLIEEDPREAEKYTKESI